MSKSKPAIFDFLTKERRTKLIILLIAFIFWLFVKLSKEYRTSETIAVVYELPDTLAWSSPPPQSIHVSYSGEGWSLLRSFSRKPIVIKPTPLNAGNITLDRRQILPLLEKQFSDGVQIIDFTPDNLSLGIDYKLQKTLPVKVYYQPTFEQGYTQKGKIQVRPDSVQVLGPKSILENLQFIGTELWKPENNKSSIKNHQLRLLDQDKTLILHPDVVAVTLNIEQLTEKSFFVPITLLHAQDSIRIFPDKVKISFSLPLSIFDSIQPIDFELVADFKDIKPGSKTNTLPIQVHKQPSAISNLRFRSKAIEFFIEKE